MRYTARLIVLVTTVMLVTSILFIDAAFAADGITEAQAEGWIAETAGLAYRIMTIIGAVLAVAVLAVFGIRWFLANPRQKADLMEKVWVYIIGAILVFGGATITKVILDAIKSMLKAPTA